MRMSRFFIFFVFFLLILYKNRLFAERSDALGYLYNKRMHLEELSKPVDLNIGSKIIRFFPENKQIIAKFIKEKEENWIKNKDTILNAFFSLCGSGIKKDTLVSFPHDTILIHGVVKSLNCGIERFERFAFSLLEKRVPYQYLNRYSDEIIVRGDSSTIKPDDKKTLIALCNPPKSTREKMLSDSTLNLPLRARLGDKSAEDSIIFLFKDAKYYESASNATEYLFLCGSKKCLSQAFIGFNKPIYMFGKKGCINGSLRVSIIEGLQRYYPYEPLFNDRYKKLKKESFITKTYEPYA